MANIKIGIVEDELLIAHGIMQTLVSLGYETTEPAINYTEALGMIVSEQPDILLLDIQLKGHKDGIDLARTVKEQFHIPFIFLTANADAATVGRAKDVNPYAYLVKPFGKDELYAAIEVCLHNFASQEQPQEPENKEYVVKDSLFIKQGQKYQKVRASEIVYVESSDVYVNIHTRNAKYLVRNSIQNFIATLHAKNLLRVHKSYAVNVELIETISMESITINGAEIPVGRSYRDVISVFLNANTGAV